MNSQRFEDHIRKVSFSELNLHDPFSPVLETPIRDSMIGSTGNQRKVKRPGCPGIVIPDISKPCFTSKSRMTLMNPRNRLYGADG